MNQLPLLPRYPQRGFFHLVKEAVLKMPGCRPGQAVCNQYEVGKMFEDAIWELTDDREVARILTFGLHLR